MKGGREGGREKEREEKPFQFRLLKTRGTSIQAYYFLCFPLLWFCPWSPWLSLSGPLDPLRNCLLVPRMSQQLPSPPAQHPFGRESPRTPRVWATPSQLSGVRNPYSNPAKKLGPLSCMVSQECFLA